MGEVASGETALRYRSSSVRTIRDQLAPARNVTPRTTTISDTSGTLSVDQS